jgi:hypothetical protein
MKNIIKTLGFITIIAVILAAYGCQSGSQGPPGPPGASTGTLDGTVTNTFTGKPVAGVQVVMDPVIPGTTITSDAAGHYAATLPIGVYTLKYQKTNFTTVNQTASLVAGQTTTRNVTIQPTSRVIVNVGTDVGSQPGAVVTLEAAADVLDESTIRSYQWTQISGVTANIASPRDRTTQITLNNESAYKAHFIELLEKPDRFEVQPVNPHVLDDAETCVFRVTVVTTTGTFNDTINVTIPLPYALSTGLRNVPIGVPVLVRSKTQNSYEWLITAPAGSKASLSDANTRFPYFTPDFAGEYIVTEKVSSSTLTIYAGTWQGAISGIDDNGRPLATTCITCHNGKVAADQFAAWKESGHAEILTENLNTSAHYGEDCFSCHSVGFNKGVVNGGFDDVSDYSAFLNSGMINKPAPDNWAKMLATFPESARMANIQCENCHGPNNHAALHPDETPSSARISISSDVCAECHGEPPRHARFQQWEQSGHANFELAIDEGGSASCARCHTGQGFLAWIEQEDLTLRLQGAAGNATADELRALGLTPDLIQPITCATCHDPHNPGNLSGKPNNTTVRIEGDTPLLPSGFLARNVGQGAICITCHNTRNGSHNEANPPTSYSAPHVAAQGDVLMGENAYLVGTGQRSPHASITDSCVRCHMEITPPPAELSYQLSGTNHAFNASLDLCSSCHSDVLDAAAFQTSYEALTEELAHKLGQYLMNKLPEKITVKDYTPHTYNNASYDVKSAAVIVDKSNIASIETVEPHGQIGFLIKFKQEVNFTYAPSGQDPHTLSLSQVEVQLGDITTDGTKAVIARDDVLVKAGWNYFLIHGDASKGIHNPDFVEDVLRSSIEALFPINVPQESD